MSKGSARRPRQISREEFRRRWEQTFGAQLAVPASTELAGFRLFTDERVPEDEIRLVEVQEGNARIVARITNVAGGVCRPDAA
jgi:hypothetical protein